MVLAKQAGERKGEAAPKMILPAGVDSSRVANHAVTRSAGTARPVPTILIRILPRRMSLALSNKKRGTCDSGVDQPAAGLVGRTASPACSNRSTSQAIPASIIATFGTKAVI